MNVIPVGKVLSLVGKAIKYGEKMVVGAVGKGGKALLDGAKKVSSKLQEGVSFVASKTKGLVNKVGGLWNKGKTKVKNDFIEAGKEFRYAIKKLGEYVSKFGGGPSLATEAAGKIPSGGKNLLKDAYQYVKETGEKDVVKKNSGADLDFRKVNVQINEIGETLASRKEIRAYKKQWGEQGIKVNIDKKGNVLPENVEAAFDFVNGEIYLRKNPSVINIHHEGFHAEQWLDIGKEQYMNLSRLEREEYVFEQVMKNKHLFDKASIDHSIEYIERLRLKYK
ncbi:zincin-like metallopeptidase toxin domain-containing protein [Bacillus sp. XF8]|uniref:zincin-like metallopeptidase toxin domain-containing protein n=1 Tax=Bacillus sp. XF8 TaxID=2819289 RepID=UPI001FB82372|nr:zincin-like metallopeptidase toxin domain-containing protein [Bacillus sp. XF8]